MALPAPDLDDRRFQDLVDDAKRLVMQRCPEWTDHNVSDPGVTLIETFAFMTDQLLYRLNRVPDRLYVKFLDLVGMKRFPPTAARVPLTFWLSAPATAPLLVPAGTSAATLRTDADRAVVFSTVEDLHVVPCGLEHVMTLSGAEDERVPRDEPLRLGIPFPAFSDTAPRPGDAMLVGLDDAAPRCLVALELDCHIHGIGVDPDRPPLLWEAWTGDGWTRCEVRRDETGGLNRPGAIVVQLPADHQTSIIDGCRAGWLRARVVEPQAGLPRYSSSPIVEGLDVAVIGATTEAVHAEIVENDVLGTSEGVAHQRFRATRTPVLTGTVECVLEVGSDGDWERWTRVDSFADSGPDDRHYVVDGADGTVQFGPAVRLPDGTMRHYGAVPARNATIRLKRYASGGGSRGNVGVGAIRTLRSSIPFVAQVENTQPAKGGVDGETMQEIRQRAPLSLRTRDRAVTAEDFEFLTREAAPEIARARCVSATEQDAAGAVVKVLVVPAAESERGRLRFEDLVPAPAALARIAARLEETRLIGTRVHIEPPRYRGVTAVVRMTASPGSDTSRVGDDALEALYGYLNPVAGGPDGTGWPFGRPVQSGDLYAVLQSVPGVELVEEVVLFGAHPVTGERGPATDRVHLDPHSLVFSYEHQVRVEESR
ncbi:putative baseplate assembly protein [Streptomyces sp. TRM70350]|uniref:putative baseplate assembly protein n=1 Tax=Streptomyces sp. TRM70350 TaxID=2856165 RepID=UPI001C445152|nr:putative baseplate assembly protein [Streptomyces sp. TRM70350]MBV7696566.1 putative baseplate assembly protein [Streptomyces sp. TRM70350]